MDNAVLEHLDGEKSVAFMEDADNFGDDLEKLAEIVRCKNEELRQLEKDSTYSDQQDVEPESMNDDIRELEEAIRLKNEELKQLEAIEKIEKDDKLNKCKNIVSKKKGKHIHHIDNKLDLGSNSNDSHISTDNSSDLEIPENRIPTQYHHVHMETRPNMVKFFNEETIQRRANALTFPQKFSPLPPNPYAFKTVNPYVCVPMRRDIRTLSGMQSVCDRNRYLNVHPINPPMPTMGYIQFQKPDVVPYNFIPVSQQVFICNHLYKLLFNLRKY